MLSGRERASTIVEAVQFGAANYVIKPDDSGKVSAKGRGGNGESDREEPLSRELNELRQQLER